MPSRNHLRHKPAIVVSGSLAPIFPVTCVAMMGCFFRYKKSLLPTGAQYRVASEPSTGIGGGGLVYSIKYRIGNELRANRKLARSRIGQCLRSPGFPETAPHSPGLPPPLCYTAFALNTAVGWCDCSGRLRESDLRFPPSVSLPKIQRNLNKLNWPCRLPHQSMNFGLAAPHPPEKRQNEQFFRTTDFAVQQGPPCGGTLHHAYSRAGRGHSAGARRERTSWQRPRPAPARRWPS